MSSSENQIKYIKKIKKLRLIPDIKLNKQEKEVINLDNLKFSEEFKVPKEINELELLERLEWEKNETLYNYLYPSLNDPNFNLKIAEKKEFDETKYDGTIYNVTEQAKKLCNTEFELSPHQQFVRNFLSFQTPYNSLLLYHGLGTGKTCSAIGVAEEMRDYLKQIGISQRIIVVASPNVQENFKLQLFNETKLKLIDGLWSIKGCTGNKFLREINPMNMRGLSKDKVIAQIKRLINDSYIFFGYTEFANYISKKRNVGEGIKSGKKTASDNKLKKNFNNRLIIIDEVHNIRITDDNKNKRVAQEFLHLVKTVDSLRLLFLSATPLYNSFREIIWLINIMNINDRRSTIEIKDVFDSNGHFLTNEDGIEIGKELLERKATGYISFVRGDNPYTFPFRIWPNEFAPSRTLDKLKYPEIQLNGRVIVQPIEHLSLFIVDTGNYQQKGYKYILNNLKEKHLSKSQSAFESLDSFNYTQLQRPIEALNMIYPNKEFDRLDPNIKINELVGETGLNNIMTYKESYTPPSKTDFEYKDTGFGRIFSQENIGNYSGKIKEITKNIINSEGVILIYSQYLDGGLIPIALALEEMGITRYGTIPSLFKNKPIHNLNLNTYKNEKTSDGNYAKYIMITGNKMLSPPKSTVENLKIATDKRNAEGHLIKIILISQAGSEGLDFKFIRQVHILEPWYNMSRIEQIIGRAVRNCSHKDLPFEKRNVEIFLYGSVFSSLDNNEEESADLYIYRLAEIKALQIGRVNRVLKEVAIDCLLNSQQQNFNSKVFNQTVNQKLSNGLEIEYKIGDKPFSSQCDYMESCSYQCIPNNNIDKINELTYNNSFAQINNEIIIKRIKQLMKDRFFYEKDTLIRAINIVKSFPIIQIYSSLDQLISDKNEFIVDKYNRLGNLINIDDLYLFQPLELSNKHISLYERRVPIAYKRENLSFTLPDKIQQETEREIKFGIPLSEGKNILNEIFNNYNIATTKQLIIRGDKSNNIWYKYCSLVIEKMENDGVSKILLEEFVISHIIEFLDFEKLLIIINYLYENNLSLFEQRIKKYFINLELTNKGITGIVLQNNGKQQLIIKKGKLWILAESEDYNDLGPTIEKNLVSIKSLSNIIGFITNFKNDYMIFKVKQLNVKRNKGARCDQSTKSDTIKLINNIIDEDKYSLENTKGINHHYQLCILQEFLLRLNDYNLKNGKRWFLSPSEAVLIKIETIFAI